MIRPRYRGGIRAAAAAVLVGLLVSGASAVHAQAAADPAEVARRVGLYNRWAAGLRTARGGGEVRLGAAGESDRSFRFALAVARPANLRLQGRLGNVTTLFDLANVDTAWTLLLPRQRQVVRGGDPGDAAGLLLAPADVLSALLPAGVSPARLRESGAVSMSGEWIRLVSPPGGGSPHHRVLYLDGEGRPRRLLVRRRSQLEPVVLEARFNDFRGRSPFPHRVRVEVPDGGQWADFAFTDVKVNDDLDERRFRVLVPAGTEEVSLERVDRGFLPEADNQ